MLPKRFSPSPCGWGWVPPVLPRCLSPLLASALACLLACALLWATAENSLAAAPKGARAPRPSILVVHSYNKDYTWTRQINLGLEQGLRGIGATIKTFYMDAKNHADAASLTQKAKEALEIIERDKPLIVVACDDAAQEYLIAPHLKGHDKPQVVFCGVNAPLEKYGYPADNTSGVHERLYLREAMALVKAIAPEIKTSTLITDASETSTYLVGEMRDDLRRGGPFQVQIKSVSIVKTIQEWKQTVQRNQTRTDSLVLALYHSLVDERTGQVVTAEEVMAWTNANNKLPTVGLVDFAANHGMLCGVLESGHEQGYLASSMVRQVLAGTPAGQLPVRRNKRGVVFLNLNTAKRLNISIPYPLIESAGIVIK